MARIPRGAVASMLEKVGIKKTIFLEDRMRKTLQAAFSDLGGYPRIGKQLVQSVVTVV
jgi:hypothetical protein